MGTELKIGIHNRAGEKVDEKEVKLRTGEMIYFGQRAPTYEDPATGWRYSLQIHDATEDTHTFINVWLNKNEEGQPLAMSEEEFPFGLYQDVELLPPGKEEWQPFKIEQGQIYRSSR